MDYKLSAGSSIICKKQLFSYVIMEKGVGNGDKVCSMRQVNQSIVEVLVNAAVARYITMVDPYVLGQLNGNSIAIIMLDLADLHIADDDVTLTIDGQANAG